MNIVQLSLSFFSSSITLVGNLGKQGTLGTPKKMHVNLLEPVCGFVRSGMWTFEKMHVCLKTLKQREMGRQGLGPYERGWERGSSPMDSNSGAAVYLKTEETGGNTL